MDSRLAAERSEPINVRADDLFTWTGELGLFSRGMGRKIYETNDFDNISGSELDVGLFTRRQRAEVTEGRVDTDGSRICDTLG